MMKGTEHGLSLWQRILPCIQGFHEGMRSIHTAYNDVLDEAEYAAGYRGDRKLAAREIGRQDAEAEKGE